MTYALRRGVRARRVLRVAYWLVAGFVLTAEALAPLRSPPSCYKERTARFRE